MNSLQMKQFGLIGKSLAHSFSKKYFQQKFRENKLDSCSYENFELTDIQALKALVANHKDLIGFNVTIPYKVSICEFLDEIHPLAKKLGAVNTVFVNQKKNTLHGFNTDVYGFAQSIKPFFNLHHERALILGTGGASKAVAYALQELGVKIMFASRTPKATNEIAYKDINTYVIAAHTMIVNTSPLGMYPDTNTYPEIPYEAIGDNHFLVDLTYNPEETIFLKNGKAQGAMILNGKDMLVFQAEKSWAIWQDEIDKNY